MCRWVFSPPFLPLNTSLTSSVLLTQLEKLQHSTEPVNSAVSVCSQRLEFISLLISHFESHLAGKTKPWLAHTVTSGHRSSPAGEGGGKWRRCTILITLLLLYYILNLIFSLTNTDSLLETEAAWGLLLPAIKKTQYLLFDVCFCIINSLYIYFPSSQVSWWRALFYVYSSFLPSSSPGGMSFFIRGSELTETAESDLKSLTITKTVSYHQLMQSSHTS